MAEKHQHQTEENQSLNNFTSFWNKNSKILIGAVAAIIIVVGGYFGYNEFVKKPKEEKADIAIYPCQQFFTAAMQYNDSNFYKNALNGDTGKYAIGFLKIIKNHDGTKAANLAKYYAGICYLHLGDYNNAVKYLKEFNTDAKQIQLIAYGNLGDAYSELKKNDEAIASYKKASTIFEDDKNNSSEYLFRAALLCESTGKTKEALDLYKQVKDKFPATDKGSLADKYIYRLSIEKNEFIIK